MINDHGWAQANKEAKKYADDRYQEMETIDEYENEDDRMFALDTKERMRQQQTVSVPDPRIGRHLYVDENGKPVDKLSIQESQKEEGLALFNAYMEVHQKVIESDYREEVREHVAKDIAAGHEMYRRDTKLCAAQVFNLEYVIFDLILKLDGDLLSPCSAVQMGAAPEATEAEDVALTVEASHKEPDQPSLVV